MSLFYLILFYFILTEAAFVGKCLSGNDGTTQIRSSDMSSDVIQGMERNAQSSLPKAYSFSHFPLVQWKMAVFER